LRIDHEIDRAHIESLMPNKLLPNRFLIHRLPACLEAIRRHYCDFGCSPSITELAARIGVTRSSLHPLLRKLATAQLIGWTPGTRRSITLPRPLSAMATSDLLWELQARGHVTSIHPPGTVAAISAWPEASVVDLAQLPKHERDLLDRLCDIP
jgi:SOS-response transcriptional repressor LexA